jgi:hypothetical protein
MTTRSWFHACVIAVLVSVTSPAVAAESIGVVGALQGTASAAGTTGARVLKVGDQVFLDEEVTTNAGSKLQLMLNDRSTITLNPNSKVKVREFAYNAEQDSGSMAMEGVKGAFRFIGGALSKQQPVTIKTPVSSIGIRGGIADTHIGPNGETNAVFLYGDALTMTNQNGQTIEITQPGQGLSMQTPTDVPTFTPPNVVQQLLGNFGPAPAGGEGAANGPVGDAPNGDGAPPQQNADGTDKDGQPQQQQNADGTPVNDNRTPEQRAADTQRYGNFSGGTQGAVPPTGPLPPLLDTAGNPVNPTSTINQIATQTTTTASNTAVGGTAIFDSQGEYKGRYAMTQAESGSNIKERGILSATGNGSEFLLNAMETAPNNGAAHAGKLPSLTSSGVVVPLNTAFKLDPNDTDTFTGFGTTTANSYYYHLDKVGSTQDINIFFGRHIMPNAIAAAMSTTAGISFNDNTGSISYFKFLPDLYSYTGSSSTGLGFFDYSVLDVGGTGLTNNRDDANFGMAIDFTNKRFLSGFLDWDDSDGLRDFAIAFGKVGSGGTTGEPSLSGAAFDFSQTGTTISSLDSRLGGINTGANNAWFGNGSGGIEAVMVEGTAPAGQAILTPAQRVSAADISPAVINENRDSGITTMKGFAAGHLVMNANGTPAVKNIWNTHSNGVTVTTDANNSTVNANLNLFEKGTSNTVDVNFGTNTNSAYLSKDLYAAQQTSVTYGSNLGATPGAYSSNNGFIANAAAITDVANRCTTCDFVHWGVWAGEVNRTVGASTAQDVAYAIPYVAGQVTDASNVPNMGTANYTGPMYGSEYNPTTNALQRVEGNFIAGIDFANRQITSFTGTVGSFTNISMTGGPVGIATTGSANFTGPLSIADTGMSATGIVNGALFGPVANQIGGNYSITGTGGVNGTGVYLGDRP